jgi:NADH pyrophosphatase NudC (nudix superfamily)
MADLLKKLQQGIDRGLTAVTTKSKEVMETAQLRSQINNLEEEKRGRLEELGNIVYTLVTHQRLDQEHKRVIEKCEALAALEKKIQEKEEGIREIQRKTQEILGQQEAQPVARCECGADLCDGMKFCGSCGKPATQRNRTSDRLNP